MGKVLYPQNGEWHNELLEQSARNKLENNRLQKKIKQRLSLKMEEVTNVYTISIG